MRKMQCPLFICAVTLVAAFPGRQMSASSLLTLKGNCW